MHIRSADDENAPTDRRIPSNLPQYLLADTQSNHADQRQWMPSGSPWMSRGYPAIGAPFHTLHGLIMNGAVQHTIKLILPLAHTVSNSKPLVAEYRSLRPSVLSRRITPFEAPLTIAKAISGLTEWARGRITYMLSVVVKSTVTSMLRRAQMVGDESADGRGAIGGSETCTPFELSARRGRCALCYAGGFIVRCNTAFFPLLPLSPNHARALLCFEHRAGQLPQPPQVESHYHWLPWRLHAPIDIPKDSVVRR